MLKRFLLIFFGLIIALPLVLSLVGTKILQFKAMGDAAAQMVMPPETVNVEVVREQPWQPTLSSVGTVVAVQGIVVRNEVEGIVREVNFEAGSMVNTGDPLLKLDMAIEQSQLQLAEATLEGAQRIFKRAKDIFAKQGISEADYSLADTNLKEATARVNNIRANMDKKIIRAPFSGRLGIRRISVGQFLDKGSEIVSLQSLTPVFVEFSLPQQRLGEIAKGMRISVTTDSSPGQVFSGEITAIEPDIDVTTRNVKVQATLDNHDGRLIPGMFVSVDVMLTGSETKSFVPSTAVQHDAQGKFVFVVEEGAAGANGSQQLVLQQKTVQLGVTLGDFVEVTGVKAGERVVSTGVFKLRPGMFVVIDETLAPKFSFTPTPDNS